MPSKKRENIQLKHGNIKITEGCLGSLVDTDLNVRFDRPEQTEDLVLINLVLLGPFWAAAPVGADVLWYHTGQLWVTDLRSTIFDLRSPISDLRSTFPRSPPRALHTPQMALKTPQIALDTPQMALQTPQMALQTPEMAI